MGSEMDIDLWNLEGAKGEVGSKVFQGVSMHLLAVSARTGYVAQGESWLNG